MPDYEEGADGTDPDEEQAFNASSSGQLNDRVDYLTQLGSV